MDKKLTLSNNKMISGVCAGIAEYFDIDPTVVRVIFVVLFAAYGSGILFYIILYFIMPKAPNNFIE